LQQYIKLTHCDLFFADAAVLVEGNVERLLLPLVIERFVSELRSCHLTILEVGGAFAYKFAKLLDFLSLPTLVITDLDSVAVPDVTGQDDEDDGRASACAVDTPGAVTSNETLKRWLPKIESIGELLAAGADRKAPANPDGSPGLVCVAYQTNETVSWQEAQEVRAGRTLEEAFALQNLDWTQSVDGKDLGLRISEASELSITELHEKLFKRVKGTHFDKTAFALRVIAAAEQRWKSPAYITEGLEWLRERLELVVPEQLANQVAEESDSE